MAASWPSWARQRFGGIEWVESSLRYRYQVTIASDSRVLVLKTENALEEFSAAYPSFGPPRRSWKWIDWQKVSKEYQGLIITLPCPYERNENPITGWYYVWNCASGCVWDVSAIQSLTFISEVPPQE